MEKQKDYDMEKSNLKCKQTYSQSKFLLDCLVGGESKSSRSTLGQLCSRARTSTNGSSTSMKRSMSGSKARMWQQRVWHALILFPIAQMEVTIENGNEK